MKRQQPPTRDPPRLTGHRPQETRTGDNHQDGSTHNDPRGPRNWSAIYLNIGADKEMSRAAANRDRKSQTLKTLPTTAKTIDKGEETPQSQRSPLTAPTRSTGRRRGKNGTQIWEALRYRFGREKGSRVGSRAKNLRFLKWALFRVLFNLLKIPVDFTDQLQINHDIIEEYDSISENTYFGDLINKNAVYFGDLINKNAKSAYYGYLHTKSLNIYDNDWCPFDSFWFLFIIDQFIF